MTGSLCKGRVWKVREEIVWLVVVGAGLWGLWSYSMKPGAVGQAPLSWPGKMLDGKFRLLMFVHPQCPCSQASLAELELLMRRCSSSLEATVFFVQPQDLDEAWLEGALWRQASAIPGVKAVVDKKGAEAALFGAETSGTVCLYAPDGPLLFQGGITGARGHEGDNVGLSFVEQSVRQGRLGLSRTAVFGCSLQGDESGDSR